MFFEHFLGFNSLLQNYDMQATSTRPNYGIDAPGFFRFFFLGGSIALALWIALF
jgi:hypothetical protein